MRRFISLALAMVIAGAQPACAQSGVFADSDTIVNVLSEPAGGLTQQNMTPEFLQVLTKSWADSFRNFSGNAEIADRVKFEPRYVDLLGKRLAVIDIVLDGAAFTKGVFGFADGEFKRIVCMDKRGHVVDLHSGTCAEKIKSVFGVTLVEAS